MELKLAFLAALAVPMVSALPQPIPQDEVNIVGGESATVSEFPFIVSITRSGSPWCGGTLLNANTVLTAAHCSVDVSASSVQVRAGSTSRSSGGVVSRVSSITIHPSFSGLSTLNNDVAIWKLSTPIASSSTISYASLAASGSDPAAGASVTVAGWGDTVEGGNNAPVNLRKVTVPVVARATCRSQYTALYGSNAITTNMFCAGLTQGGKDACQGDSGGPIVDSSRTVVGVVSWGEGCAQAGYPGVYARVGSVRSFIDSNA
ncbi:hypothetical protein ACHAPJ_011415 [Fusarium lateritium]